MAAPEPGLARRLARYVALVLGALALAACGGSSGPVPTATPAVTAQVIVVTRPPAPTQSSGGPADHARGAESPYLTIVQYGDFQDAATVDVARALLRISQQFPADVRLVWRHFPQESNDKAALAAQAGEAAAAQGRFWEFHDLILARQGEWAALTPDAFRAALRDYAAQAGIPDLSAFQTALDTAQYAALVDAARADALATGFRAVPALTFRDEPYTGRIDEFTLGNFTRLILLEKRQYDRQPAMIINVDNDYKARLVTEKGDVLIQLFVADAPVTVNNFVFLAREGWYDDITFFAVTPEIAQTGDPSDTGLGGAGYTILDEADNGLIFDREGLVAMGRQRGAANSASSQFFITYGPLPPEGFNGQYTIFGMVLEGMSVLRQLTPRDPFDTLRYPNPPPGDRLLRVEIIETPGS
ncbi:MAG: peptidylprolyl isomerase [Anaerolineae bacterium]|nr:peptidylprolyl isomerase [Anaerolineae bacterium]